MSRDMTKFLGDGGMPLLGRLGMQFTSFTEGTVEASWVPTALACNPNGPVQGGVYGVVLDGAMNFATLSRLERGERCTTLEMKMSFLRSAKVNDQLTVKSNIVKIGGKIAFLRAVITNAEGKSVVEASGTQMLLRNS